MIYESGAPERSNLGSNDISLALKRVWHTKDERWGFGIEGRVLFPVESSPVLGTDTESSWINAMADYTTGGLIIRGALGLMSSFETFDSGFVTVGMAVRTDFHPDHFGFVELYTETPVSSTGEEFPLGVMVGGGVGVLNDVILDFGLLIGLTDSTVFPGVGVYTGVTIEI